MVNLAKRVIAEFIESYSRETRVFGAERLPEDVVRTQARVTSEPTGKTKTLAGIGVTYVDAPTGCDFGQTYGVQGRSTCGPLYCANDLYE